MAEQFKMPNPGEWISVGKNSFAKRSAVVSSVQPSEPGVPATVEAVYLDEQGRAINEVFCWREPGQWEFAIAGPCGGYADNYSRLRPYVSILRRGRNV